MRKRIGEPCYFPLYQFTVILYDFFVNYVYLQLIRYIHRCRRINLQQNVKNLNQQVLKNDLVNVAHSHAGKIHIPNR